MTEQEQFEHDMVERKLKGHAFDLVIPIKWELYDSFVNNVVDSLHNAGVDIEKVEVVNNPEIWDSFKGEVARVASEELEGWYDLYDNCYSIANRLYKKQVSEAERRRQEERELLEAQKRELIRLAVGNGAIKIEDPAKMEMALAILRAANIIS